MSASWPPAPQSATASTPQFGPNWSTTGFSDQTIWQTVRLSSGGSQIRIRLSNRYGTKPLDIAGAAVAESAGGAAARPGTARALTFHRDRSVTVAAGQVIASDAASLPVSPLESVTVTLYLTGTTGPATFHEDGLTTTYRGSGNHLSVLGVAGRRGGLRLQPLRAGARWQGQPNLTVIALFPLMVYLVLRWWDGTLGRTAFTAWVALLMALQFYTFNEAFADLTVVAAGSLAIGFAVARRAVWSTVARLAG